MSRTVIERYLCLCRSDEYHNENMAGFAGRQQCPIPDPGVHDRNFAWGRQDFVECLVALVRQLLPYSRGENEQYWHNCNNRNVPGRSVFECTKNSLAIWAYQRLFLTVNEDNSEAN